MGTGNAIASNNHGGHLARPAIVENWLYLRPAVMELDSGKVLEMNMAGGGGRQSQGVPFNPAATSPAGHPAQREVPPLVAGRHPRPTRGSPRCAPPQGPLCVIMKR